MERKEVIRSAYRMTGGNNFYDGMITCSTLSGKAVCRLVWDMNKAENDAYLEKALSGIPEHFSGRLLEVPVGTGILTMPVYQTLPEDAPQFVKDYYAYYKTPRGYHPRSLNSNGGWNVTSSLSFLNMPILQYSSEIRSAVLLVHGEKAHSRYFSETAYSKLTGGNKELLIIPGASHTDLYDQIDIIPFEKLKAFFEEYLK